MGRNRRILIVDDQQDLREQLAKLLLRSGKKNETVSLVQQMRARLLGAKAEEEPTESAAGPENTYEVDTAGQGEEAFDMVKKSLEKNTPYAMMFLDMRMPPGWDGLQTAKKIREIDKFIEIVIMTAYADHDQKTIAETVGTPEKLLYIKKPFQSEEIHQLALSLTAKWDFEETERTRKMWLENLIRGMSKVKVIKTGKAGDTANAVLKSILSFTNSDKGFLAVLDSTGSKWKVECFSGMESKDALDFVEKNSARLIESRTTQTFEGRYLLPLKREGYSAVVVISDAVTQSDPEWYKLLSLMVMTSGEVLSTAALIDSSLSKEPLAVASLLAKLSSSVSSDISAISSAADALKSSGQDTTDLSSKIAELKKKIDSIKQISETSAEKLTIESIMASLK